MALRLTKTAAVTPDEPSSNDRLIKDLDVRATRAIRAGEFSALAQVAREIPENHDDPNRRYHGVKHLTECALAAAAAAPAAQARALFVTAAEIALDALEREPREPALLSYAGVALYELWSISAARALFEAAQRLDPELPHLAANLKQANRRQRELGRAGRTTREATLVALAARAQRVAEQAQPANGLRLSLCMIVKDEEEMLPKCLAAAAPAVDEIIVVDTGSTDGTVEIARSYGARVIEFPWTGSFSEARNVSFAAATGDWMMFLDADEVLVAEDAQLLRELTRRIWREGFYLTEFNYTGETGDGSAVVHNALRVFRNRPHYRFQGRLHEQITTSLPAYVPERFERTTVRIDHYGYLGAVREAKEKSRRNLELLEAQKADGVENSFQHFNLGSEYQALGDIEAAVRELTRGWEMVLAEGPEARHGFSSILLVRLVRALRSAGQPERAISRGEEGLERFPGHTDIVLEQGYAASELGREDEAMAYLRRCIEMGDAPAHYTATRGCGSYLPRIAMAEIHTRRGEIAEARELLTWCMQHHSDFFGVVLPYASLRLRAGDDPGEVAADVEAQVSELTSTTRFMLAIAMHEAGALGQAETQYRRILEVQPQRTPVRVALAELLLARREWAEAASEASAVPDGDPRKPIALQTELFALMTSGRVQEAAALLGGPAAGELPEPTRELFAAALELAERGATGRRLALESIALLETMLEALLRVQEFTLFEQLVPALELYGIAERERRELLARLYLRRGFLASAAEEWMAVCQSTPDARAFTGLGRVALAHGLAEDAVSFAGEALRLDPGHAEAAQLLERCLVAASPALAG